MVKKCVKRNFFQQKKRPRVKIVESTIKQKKNKTTESRFIQQIWWKKCEPVASFNSFSFIKIVEWKRKTKKKKKCLTWNSHDFETNLSKFWSGNKNWKKNFFWRIVAAKAKAVQTQKSGFNFSKKVPKFFEESFRLRGQKIYLFYLFLFFSTISKTSPPSSPVIPFFRSREKMVRPIFNQLEPIL